MLASTVFLAALIAGPTDDLLERVRPAAAAGRLDEALKLADQAVAAAPNDPAAWSVRASLHSARRDPAKAVVDLDRVLQIDPQAASAYDRRGSEYFKQGRVSEA